jgi:putative Mg2+ transporter-C (MgtC) family protein
MISETEIAIRIGVAFILGAIVGIERELDNQPAGLRTNIILVVGSALAMILSVTLAHRYEPVGGIGDPARLAAQVISGVGFLGAGAILHAGVTIRGLTTAATIWTMAVVGLAVGAGYFYAAGMVTVALVIVLSILNKVENKLFHRKMFMPITMWIRGVDPDVAEIRNLFNIKHVKLLTISIEKDYEDQDTKISLEFSSKRANQVDYIQEKISQIPGLRKVHFGKFIQI